MRTLLLVLLFLFSTFGWAQVGVNTTTPDPSSMLDISATNKGVLVPRVSLVNVTTTMLDGTNTAATGLLIWNTNAATVGGNGVGFYFFNGTQWMPITQTATSDHDIYEVGSTNPPNTINDNKYTEGSLSIGTNTAATGVLDVDNAVKATSVDINNTFATNPTGIDLNLTSNAAGKTGIKTQFNGTAATGTNSFIQNTDNMLGNTSRTAINNDFSGTSSSISTSITGLKNDFKSTSNYYAILYGVSNSFASTTNAWGYGMLNSFTNGGSTPSFGVVNAFNGTSTGDVTGFSNSSSNRSGTITGLENNFSGTGNGIHYGISNILTGTGIGDKYGTYNFIPNTTGGTQYGLYSDVLKSGSYAGYFLGNVSIGTTTLNNYILPASRGTNGQTMQTDGAGNVSWVTPVDDQTIDVLSLTGDTLNISLQDDGMATQTLNLATIDNQATDVFSLTGTTLNLSLQNDGVATQSVNLASLDTDNQQIDVLTLTGDNLNISLQDDGVATQTINLAAIDNQATDVFSLTGNTLNLSLQNDGVATQTVDLSSLKDADWYEVGGTLPPNSITDNKYTQGSITIGTNTAATGVLDIDNSTKNTSLDITNTYSASPTGINVDINSTSSNKVGINVLHSGTTTGFGGISSMLKTIDSSIGDFNRVGLYQGFIGESNNTSIDYIGVRNAFAADNFFGDMIGAENVDFSTSNGNRYGTSNSFYGTGNGVNYGVYNYLSSTGTGAKYGVYNLILSTAGGTHYGIYSNVLKAGSYAGYFLGNVSVGTNTTNNYILPPSRGTNGQIMQTDATGNVTWVNPATDSDDQATDIFSLTGTTLNLSLQNDGVATQTVNLASLDTDNQIIDALSLTGDVLNISLQDDGVATQILNLATIDNQATDVFSLTGTSLNLSLQNDGVATQTVDLSSLLGTDDQNIQNLAFNTTTNILTVGIENGTSQTVDLSTLDTGGDVTAVTAGAGLSGGGITGTLTLTAAANNGLNVDATADAIQLGGPLLENTSITQGTFSMDINLDSTGDFAIQDNGTDVFFVGDNGNIGMGTSLPLYPVHIIDNTTTNTSAVYIDKIDNTTAETSGIYIEKTSAGTGRNHAIFTEVNGAGTGQKYGIFNQISTASSGNQYGTRNYINGASPSNQFGTFNNLDNAGTANQYGVYNGMRGTAASTLYATYNEFDNGTTATNLYGTYTNFSINATGTGSKYGSYSSIDSSIGGTHYGTYNDVGVANGWSGYFLGRNYISERLSIGETDNANAAVSINKNSTGTYSHIELKESTANDGARLSFSNTAEATNNWLLYGRADNTITDGRFNIFHTTTGNIVQITGDGLFGIMRAPTTNQLEINGTASKSAAGAFIANSDSRLKKNIATISPTDALNKVLSLRGVTYEWNDDKTGMNRPEGKQLGFVAQEIQQVFPEKVSEDKQGYLQTAYGDYDPIIFQAIKALSDKIDKLEKENEELKQLVKNKK